MIHNATRLVGLAVAGSVTFAAPALAQDIAAPFCGSGMAVGWIGDAPDASDVSVTADPLQLDLTAPARSQGLIAFRVSSDSQPVRIEAQAAGDPALTLMTADGAHISDNDDTPESLNSRIEENLGPGDYCVALRSYGGEEVTASLRIARQDQPRLLNETARGAIDTCTADTGAVALTDDRLEAAFAAGIVSATLSGDATSYFRFTIGETIPVTLRAVSPQLDPVIKLFDANGGMIAENDDADGTDSRLDFPSGLVPGSYCLGVTAYSPAPGNITVSAQKLDRDAFLMAAYRRGEIAPPAGSNYPIQQIDLATIGQTVVLQDGGAQWFSFQVARPTVLIVDAYGSLVGGDPKLALFSTQGAVIGQNDDYGDTLDAKLGPVLLGPGEYNLALTDLSRGDQPGAPMRPVGLVFDVFERVGQPQ